MRKLCLASLIGILVIGTAVPVFSQIYFGITPIRAEHAGKPGDSITDIFMVRNNASAPIRLKVYAENWMLQQDGTPAFIGAQSTTYSCRDWIKVNPQDFRLNPNEIKSVRYTVTIPQDTPSAGYHASVSFESVPDTDTAKAGSRMFFTGKIAAAVYVKVGHVPVDGDIIDMKMDQKGDLQALVLVMKNTGKTHFRIKGGVDVFDSENRKVLELELPDEVVLPESEREVRCVLTKNLDPGIYRLFCRLDIGREEVMGLEKKVKVEK